MLKLLVEYSPLLSLFATAGLAILGLWFDARQRKAIDAAVDPLKADITELTRRVDANEADIQEARADIGDLPSKADLARVEGEVKATHIEAAAAAAGVMRLENIFLQRGVEKV